MDFIERLFGISPDAGSGSFEFVLLLILGVGAYLLRTAFTSQRTTKG